LFFDEVINTALAQAKIKAANRQVSMNIELGTEPCRVLADQEKIQWVVMELVGNAIKFTNPGGRVEC
jgi:signal transduction histidine kinase